MAIHGVSYNARAGALVPKTVPVAKMERPGTPETASPAVEGRNKTRIEPEDAETSHPCAMVGPKQTRGKCDDGTWGTTERNALGENENETGQRTETQTDKTQTKAMADKNRKDKNGQCQDKQKYQKEKA